MLPATTQLVLFQINATLHMTNKAFYLLWRKSCFAILIKSKLAGHLGTSLNLLLQSKEEMGFIVLIYIERRFRGI